MPNWCWNVLTIEGKEVVVEEFIEFVKNENGEDEQLFDFNTILPSPDKYEKKYNNIFELWVEQGHFPKDVDMELPDFLKGEYTATRIDWCEGNWGTKWNACNVDLDCTKPGLAIYHFDTAWSPPEPVVIALGESFPNLTFHLKFMEPGMLFRGQLLMKNGEILNRYTEQIPDEDIEKYISGELEF